MSLRDLFRFRRPGKKPASADRPTTLLNGRGIPCLFDRKPCNRAAAPGEARPANDNHSEWSLPPFPDGWNGAC